MSVKGRDVSEEDGTSAAGIPIFGPVPPDPQRTIDSLRTRLQQVGIERDEAKVARDFAELACQRKDKELHAMRHDLSVSNDQRDKAEADAAVMRGLLSDSKRVLSRVLDWCLMDSPNFEIDGDAIGEAVHNINVFEGKSTLNPKPQDVKP